MTLRASELIAAMEDAFEREWDRTKQTPLPAAGADDRKLVFAAVAHGMFNYLEDHQGEFISSVTLRRDSQDTWYRISNLDLGIAKGS